VEAFIAERDDHVGLGRALHQADAGAGKPLIDLGGEALGGMGLHQHGAVTGEAGAALRDAGKEFGTVTGRPRRCGWFDIPLLRYAHAINHLSSLFVTKLDVLDYLRTIPVCTGYRYRGKPLDWMPAIAEEYEEIEPVYEELPGWNRPTGGIASFDGLPQAARDYIAFLEDRIEVEIGGVSTGPEREQSIVREGSALAKLVSA